MEIFAWCSMSTTKLKKLASKQKASPMSHPGHYPRVAIAFYKIMRGLCILNTYHLKIYDVLYLMLKVKRRLNA